MPSLGRVVQQAMDAADVNGPDVERRTNGRLSSQWLSQVVLGQVKEPSVEKLQELADAIPGLSMLAMLQAIAHAKGWPAVDLSSGQPKDSRRADLHALIDSLPGSKLAQADRLLRTLFD